VPALDQKAILESAVQIYIGKEAIKVSEISYCKKNLLKIEYLPIYG
jgi:hypothetical protein